MKFRKRYLHAGVLAVCLCMMSCGGGGDEEPGGNPQILLDVYAYIVGNTLAGVPLGVTFDQDGDTYKVVVSPGATLPSGDFDTRDDSWTVDAGSSWVLDSDAGPDDFLGVLSITVTESIDIPADRSPDTGAYLVEHEGDDVVVEFVAGGVELSVDGGPAQFYDWETFDELTEDPGSTLEEAAASFANQVMQFLYQQYDLVVALLLDIDDSFEYINPRFEQESVFPPGWTIPPEIDDPAWYSLTWYDRGAEGLGAGDDFGWSFGDWPVAEDSLGRGRLDFRNLRDAVDGANRLVQTGFGPTGVDGGMFYDNLELVQLEEDSGVVTIFSILDMEGGYSLVFEED
jgi:hypothetical protein